MLVPVNYCIRGLGSIGVCFGRKSNAAMPQEEWRHTVRRFRRAVTKKIMI